MKTINFPRVRIIRRGTIDLNEILTDIQKKYIVGSVLVSPLALWKIYELIKPLYEAWK